MYIFFIVKSACFILLQGVPPSINLDHLREDIRRVKGVNSLHELHVWQLSEPKIIGSLHVRVEKDAEYMRVAKDIREILHKYGVHSCAIQPEFAIDVEVVDVDDVGDGMNGQVNRQAPVVDVKVSPFFDEFRVEGVNSGIFHL
jgi:divalent metal cation (Fe/Co/Zn/Cd) transporter